MKKEHVKTVIVAVIFILMSILYGIDRGQYHKLEPDDGQSISLQETVTSEIAQEEETDLLRKATEVETSQNAVLWVHVCGAVVNAGVYQLSQGQIVADAILAAGGVLEEAAADYLNLARSLRDGEKIIVPFLKDIEDPYGSSSMGATETAEEVYPAERGTLAENHLSENSLVNINAADETLLMTLSGIGKARAEAIIAYRKEHGSFQKKEDIMKVAGIKTAAYEKIKDRITV